MTESESFASRAWEICRQGIDASDEDIASALEEAVLKLRHDGISDYVTTHLDPENHTLSCTFDAEACCQEIARRVCERLKLSDLRAY